MTDDPSICEQYSSQAIVFHGISLPEIESSEFSPNKINGSNSKSNLLHDRILIYKTNEGRYGKLLIREYGYILTIEWVTFDFDGSIYSVGDNLAIRGTCSCDLDFGRESRTSRDFRWKQVNNVERYLVPENGAKFNIYQGLTSLSGDTSCAWGAADGNPCVEDVLAELDRLEDRYQSAGRIRFLGYAYPYRKNAQIDRYILHRIRGSYEHIQSIGRIAGIGNNEYMVFTHSTCSGQSRKYGALAVVRMGANQNTGGGPFGGMPYGGNADQNIGNRTVARTYSRNNHPCGLCVLGHYVYVAQWCQPHGNNDWCRESKMCTHGLGFSVYDVSRVNLNSIINSNPPICRHYRHVYGESWIGSGSTCSIAAVKLSNGQYLVALGSYNGIEYGFYTAPSPTGPFTFHNSSKIGEKVYWGQNACIVTECGTGDLYMFQIERNSNDVDQVHLYKLVLNNGVIGFNYITSRQFYCRGGSVDRANNWCNFDTGAGMYVTPTGNLILYATEKLQSEFGNIRLVEFS